MTKLEQLRRRIIELVHGLLYEKAKVYEFGEHCRFIYGGSEWIVFRELLEGTFECFNPKSKDTMMITWDMLTKPNHIDVVGKPVSGNRMCSILNRNMFDGQFFLKNDTLIRIRTIHLAIEEDKICDWVLIAQSGKEATLEDQSEETIDALYQLLCTTDD